MATHHRVDIHQPNSSHEPHVMRKSTEVPVRPFLTRFLETRRGHLTRRAGRIYADVFELLGEYLEDLAITEFDLLMPDPDAPQFGFSMARWLGGGIDIESFSELLIDFQEEHLAGALECDRVFLRVSEVALRDLVRWLRGKRVSRPVAQKPRTASYPHTRRASHSPTFGPRHKAPVRKTSGTRVRSSTSVLH